MERVLTSVHSSPRNLRICFLLEANASDESTNQPAHL